jgi:hypothetical protein
MRFSALNLELVILLKKGVAAEFGKVLAAVSESTHLAMHEIIKSYLKRSWKRH